MAWLAVDKSGNEVIFDCRPMRKHQKYCAPYWSSIRTGVTLPRGTIKYLIGRELTWDDEPVEFNEVME